MGSLFSRGVLSLFLTLAWAGGAVGVLGAADVSVGVADATERVPPVGDATERVPPVGDATERVPPVGGPTSVSAVAAWPAALAPAWRDFEAKCAAKTATRGDLIALKKFIAASAIDGAAKTNLTRQARKVYQESKKKESRLRK